MSVATAGSLVTPFTAHARVDVPLICGAMYPCSNPELVAAVSDAGGIGIVQPISLTYVHGYDFRAGLQYIRRLTSHPIGFNALIEQSSRRYHERMVAWVEIAIEEGVRFFVTSLGNPRWVVDRVRREGGVVYHDITERKWAQKGHDAGVHGLIAVNDRAGGHAGPHDAQRLLDGVADLGLPVACAGGVGSAAEFVAALRMGYAATQVGTRFIATPECKAHQRYKQAILDSDESDIVLTERLTGVPVAVIDTPYIQRVGTHAGWIARRLLRGRRSKHLMRTAYALRSLWQLKRGLARGDENTDYWQAGKSVATITAEQPAGEIVREFAAAARESAERDGPFPASRSVDGR
ncbi:MAG TPA: nitronate monooxygenase [Gemmatimonadaceae bacterium]|nr:nitronate monooxygenase [Gemmatimonadaceae bacterium]